MFGRRMAGGSFVPWGAVLPAQAPDTQKISSLHAPTQCDGKLVCPVSCGQLPAHSSDHSWVEYNRHGR